MDLKIERVEIYHFKDTETADPKRKEYADVRVLQGIPVRFVKGNSVQKVGFISKAYLAREGVFADIGFEVDDPELVEVTEEGEGVVAQYEIMIKVRR